MFASTGVPAVSRKDGTVGVRWMLTNLHEALRTRDPTDHRQDYTAEPPPALRNST